MDQSYFNVMSCQYGKRTRKGFLLLEFVCVVAVFVLTVQALFFLQSLSFLSLMRALEQSQIVSSASSRLEGIKNKAAIGRSLQQEGCSQTKLRICMQWKYENKAIQKRYMYHTCAVIKNAGNHVILAG